MRFQYGDIVRPINQEEDTVAFMADYCHGHQNHTTLDEAGGMIRSNAETRHLVFCGRDTYYVVEVQPFCGEQSVWVWEEDIELI